MAKGSPADFSPAQALQQALIASKVHADNTGGGGSAGGGDSGGGAGASGGVFQALPIGVGGGDVSQSLDVFAPVFKFVCQLKGFIEALASLLGDKGWGQGFAIKNVAFGDRIQTGTIYNRKDGGAKMMK